MNTRKTSIQSGLILAAVAFICTAISIGVYQLTKPKIEEVIRLQQQQLFSQIIPLEYFDNDLLASCQPVEKNPLIERLCKAEKNGEISAYAFETTAPDGYSGNIHLLVGITPQGEILGVRVLEHNETPGLGDKIDTRISNWILSFNGKTITQENQNQWTVKKDGGQFDQFTGATITPRAVVKQVYKSGMGILEIKP